VSSSRNEPVRLLCLFGGGLDSRLTRELLARAGSSAEFVHFRTGFVKDARLSVVAAESAGSGAAIDVVDVARDYLDQVVRSPRFGYGSAMNPCLDCRIFMLRRADRIARERGIDLLCTGEVVGQRSIDQSHHALARAEDEAGVAGRVVRPLSAGLLPEVLMDTDGRRVVEESLRLHGRSRRGQLELASRWGVEARPVPSGGCCKLADPVFAARLRDLLSHHGTEEVIEARLARLDRGRHFRLAWNLKVIVGRDEAESRWLSEQTHTDWTCRAADRRGAFCLVEGTPEGDREIAVAQVAARYAGSRGEGPVEIELRCGDQRRLTRVAPAAEEDLARWRI
jgi:tRNA-specific 2-thiouridylase